MRRLEFKSDDGRETLLIDVNWLGVFEWTPEAFLHEVHGGEDGSVSLTRFSLSVRPLPYKSKSIGFFGSNSLACINYPVRSRVAVMANWISYKFRRSRWELRMLAWHLGWARCENGGIPKLCWPWRKAESAGDKVA